MGVIFAKPDKGDRIIAVAKNSERALGVEDAESEGPAEDGPDADAPDLDGEAAGQAHAVTLSADSDQIPGGNE
jgi:DNA gyrase subunit A